MIRHHIKKRLEKVIYADDATEDVGLLLRLRLPWLIVGLLIGTGMTLLVSRFEAVLSREVSLAFFIPVIVYMSGAVATQTETIYVRNLARRQAKFSTYLVKEFILGLLIGGLCGSFIGLASWVWINSFKVALTVGLAMFINISLATLIALLVPTLLVKFNRDPAIGGGPFTSVIQDLIAILVYFWVAIVIIL